LPADGALSIRPQCESAWQQSDSPCETRRPAVDRKNTFALACESIHIDGALGLVASVATVLRKREPAESDLYRALHWSCAWHADCLCFRGIDEGADVTKTLAGCLISGTVTHWLALAAVWQALTGMP
jgi:hypothetical protein